MKKLKKHQKIIIFSVIGALALGLFWGLGDSDPAKNFRAELEELSFKDDTQRDISENEEVTLTTLSQDMEKYSKDSQIDIKTRNYTNSKYGFSIKIPENMTVSNFQEGREGEVILLQSSEEDAKNGAPWIQIFVLPFDEEGLITPQRIQKDLPSIKIEEPQYAVIGEKQFKALIFYGQESGIGETREVWFVKNGYLFQINTSKEYEALLGKMLETIRF